MCISVVIHQSMSRGKRRNLRPVHQNARLAAFLDIPAHGGVLGESRNRPPAEALRRRELPFMSAWRNLQPAILSASSPQVRQDKPDSSCRMKGVCHVNCLLDM